MPDYREILGTFRDQTALPPEAAERIRRRLGAPQPQGGRWTWAAGLAAAALALLTWRAAPGLIAPTVLEGPLVTGDLTQSVALKVDGEGLASGTSETLDLRWAVGTLDVEVEPGRGVSLQVHTDEATVRVVGTGFRVVRDALGTAIEVRHGRVEATCRGGAPTLLDVGARLTCAPSSAAGQLGRLRRLQEEGAPAATVLDEATRALAGSDADGTVRSELQSVQLDALVALDRTDEALALAERLSAVEGPRTLDHHRVAARLHLNRPGQPDCAAALPHLRALADAGRLEDDAPWLSICDKESNP